MNRPRLPAFGLLRWELQTIICTLVLGALAFLVLYPALSILVTSFEIGPFGQPTGYGIENWRAAFDSPRVMSAIANTISLSVTRQLIAFVVGVLIAWLIARTNLPGASWLEFGFWVALFMPPLPVAMAWVLIAGGPTGLVNLAAVKYLGFDHSPFDIYSWWGIVWVHIMTSSMAVKVFLLVPAFRGMDAALEESARTCGSSIFGVLRRIVLPIMLPTIVMVMLLGLIRSMQAFEVELILGTPAQIDVYSTFIYRAINQQPPLHGVASVLSMSFVAMIVPFIALQQWYGLRHAHATVTGKYSMRLQDLGRWRWPLFWAILLLLVAMTLLPLVFLLVGSFMKIFGNLNLPMPWTTRNWEIIFSRPDIIRALTNSLELAFGAGLLGMVVFSALAYIMVKTRYAGRRLLDFLTWLPTVIPGIVISLGVLQMFVGTALFRPLYGTVWVLIIAITLGSVTVGTQIIKGGLLQLSAELEEASWTAGASRAYTFRRIVLPLIAPSVAVVGLEIFATAVAAVGVIAMLGTGQNQPLSLLQLQLMDAGRFEAATIVGLVITATTLLAALLARFVGLRMRLGGRAV